MPTNEKLDLDAPESNNNNEYLERPTRTGPKRLHVLYKYILSTFNAYNMNAHTHSLFGKLDLIHRMILLVGKQ